MTHTFSPIDTPLATVQRTSADRVEVRFKPGATLTAAGISSILNVRDQLGKDGPSLVLIVLPQEEMDFDIAMITKDHYSGRPVKQHSRAVAWVVHNARNDQFTRLYFSHFPSPVPSRIFMTEAKAVAWLEGQ